MATRVHLHLKTRDLAAARAFYRAFLGTEPVKEKPGYLKFLPAFARLNLAISTSAAEVVRASSDHAGIQLESTAEVLGHRDRVKAAGLPVREEMGVDCCHANQDKFWVRDPDGLEWEVYHLNRDLEPAEAPKPAASSACCAEPAASPGSTSPRSGCA
jgi:lactoylglutathione lyase